MSRVPRYKEFEGRSDLVEGPLGQLNGAPVVSQAMNDIHGDAINVFQLDERRGALAG